MATASLSPHNEAANSGASLGELADEIQTQVRRIDSLAEAIDHAIDISTADEEQRAALGRALDYVHLLKEAASKAGDLAEQVAVRSPIGRYGDTSAEA